MKVSCVDYTQYGKIKNVPNHQPLAGLSHFPTDPTCDVLHVAIVAPGHGAGRVGETDPQLSQLQSHQQEEVPKFGASQGTEP
jgi:hypothetical protein